MDAGIARAESSLKRLAATITKHPVAAAGALGSALVAAATQAAFFADKIQQSMMRVGTLIPTARGHLKAMERDLVAISQELPFSIGELAEGLARVGKLGARGPAEALQQLRVAAQAASATGEDLATTIDTLDQVMDAFGISAQDSGKAMDQLVAATQRGVPIADLATVLERAAATAHQAGVGLDQVVAATISMREAGVPTRQIVSAFSGGLGELRREGEQADGSMGRLASSVNFASGQLKLAGAGAASYAENLEAVNAAGGLTVEIARRMNLTAEAQAKIVKNQLTAEWLKFGNTVLPLVIGGLKLLNRLLTVVTGSAGDKRLTDAARTVLELGPGLRAILTLGARPDTTSLTRFNAAMTTMFRGLEKGHVVLGLTREEVGSLIQEVEKASPEALRHAFAGQLGVLKDVEATRARILASLREAQGIALTAEGGAAPAPGRPGVPPELLQRREAFLAQIRSTLAGLTTTIVDDLEQALEKMRAQATAVFGKHLPDEVTGAFERLRQQLETERFLEPFERELDGVEQRVGQLSDAFGEIPPTLGAEILPDLERIQGALLGQLALVEENGVEYVRIKAQLDRVDALWKKIVQTIGEAKDATADTRAEHEKLLDKLQRQATAIERAGRGALQLAQAFGLVDENSARALENVLQIAANIPGAAAGDPGAILSVIGGLSELIGSLFGESPETKRQKEILRANTDAIEKLTRTMGEFGLNITGKQFGGVQTAAQATLTALPPGELLWSRAALPKILTTELAKLGLSMADLREVAQALGIALAGAVPTTAELQQLLDAISQTQLTQFATTFTGQLEALGHFFELFDITDPLQQLQNLV